MRGSGQTLALWSALATFLALFGRLHFAAGTFNSLLDFKFFIVLFISARKFIVICCSNVASSVYLNLVSEVVLIMVEYFILFI